MGRPCYTPFVLYALYGLTVKTLVILLVFSFDDRYRPSLTVVNFHLPPQSFKAIYFDLKLRNKNALVGFSYNDLNLTFSYGHGVGITNNISTVARYTVPGFYQGYKKTTHRRDQVEILPGAVLGENTTGPAVFMVDVVSTFKYKTIFGKSNTKKLLASAHVEVVNYTTGEEVVLKKIKLNYLYANSATATSLPTMLLVLATASTALILLALN